MPILTDREIRALKPAEKPIVRWDGAGLHLHVTTAGTRSWRFRYAIAGKRRVLVLGRYPEMSLADARAARDDARRALREGYDPGASTRAAGGPSTFEAVARDWIQRMAPSWRPRYAADVVKNLERDIFPALGRLPVASIQPETILAVLRAMESRGAVALAHKVRRIVATIFERQAEAAPAEAAE
jgi:hypothetical protein